MKALKTLFVGMLLVLAMVATAAAQDSTVPVQIVNAEIDNTDIYPGGKNVLDIERDEKFGQFICSICSEKVWRVELIRHKENCYIKFCKYHRKNYGPSHYNICECSERICKMHSKTHIDKHCTILKGGFEGCYFCCKNRKKHIRRLLCASCLTDIEQCSRFIFPHRCTKIHQ
jgi:hypothetical protein